MKNNVEFSHLARFDLEAIVEHYYNVSPKTASRYYHGIIKAATRLESFAEVGRIVPELEEDFVDRYRELIFENYRIIYRCEDKNYLFIVRVVDSRRLLTLDFVKEIR